jgi:hypothetical protein
VKTENWVLRGCDAEGFRGEQCGLATEHENWVKLIDELGAHLNAQDGTH